MKYLILIAHADPKSDSSAHKLAAEAKKTLLEQNHEVRVVDLVKEGFKENASADDFVDIGTGRFSYGGLQKRENLCKTIRDQQANLEWCECLLVFAPIWFYTLPACFLSFMQRVLTNGWGYDFSIPREKLALYGRKAMLVITAGAGPECYSHLGEYQSLEGMLYQTTYCLHGCGFDVKRTFPVYYASELKPEDFAERAKKAAKAVAEISSRPSLPFEEKHEGKDQVELFLHLNDID